MSADRHIMEALARIERKMDFLLQFATGTLPQIEAPGDCPVCKQAVTYDVDINEGVVLRKCGCKTGKIALDMKSFAPPALPTRKERDEQRSDEEDRLDTNRGQRPAGRR